MATVVLGVCVCVLGAAACGGGGAGVGAARARPMRRTVPPGPTSTSLDEVVPRIESVRRIQVTYVDVSRPTVARAPVPASRIRVLRTSVWVPQPGHGPWPLVVFGHGFASSVSRYDALLERVARAGFVVAAPEFPGSSSALPGVPDERDLREEPCDLLAVAGKVQHALAPPALAGRVRGGPVVLAGQSDGATAAAFAALADPLGACGGPPVAGVVAFSADPVPVRPGATATVLAVTGSADEVNPPAHTRALFDEAPVPAYLVTSSGDDHIQPSTDSTHRTAIDAVVIDYLRATMLGDQGARARLVGDARRPGLLLEQRSRSR
jgi:dienelactone hydrolase